LELNILSDDKDEARASLRVMRDRFLHDQERINELIEGKVKIPRNVRSVNLKKGNPPSRMSLVQGPALPSDVHSWTLETIAHRGPVYQLAGSPDGRRFVSMSADETFRVWDTDTGRLESIFVPGPLLEDAVWSSDGQSLTVAQYHPRNTDISIWDTQMKELTRTESLGVVGTDFMKISPQAKFVAIHLADVNSMQIWDLTHRQIHHTLSGQDKPRAFDWSPNDRYYSILKPTGTLTVWDVSDNSRVYATGDPNQPVTAMAWIPQGDQLSFACNGHIDIVNMPTGSIAESIQLPPSRPVDDFAWSQTGRRFSFISEKHVSFMGRARGVLQTLHLPYITAQTWVGDYLVLSDSQGSLFCVDPSSCKIIQRWISNWCGPARQVRISPSENRVALLSANGMISLWDMYTWEPIYSKGAESVNSDDLQNAVLLWSPTGDELVCNDPSGSTLIFRDSYSLQTLRKLPIPETRVTCGARSEKGLLAVGTEKGDLYVSRWSQTKFVSHLQGHQGPVNAVVWIPSDQLLVSAGQDRTIRFWDVLTGQCTRMITDHGAPISDLALSPDQKTLASIDLNRQVLLWDASSGTQIQRLSDDMIDRPQWKGELTVTAWSPDGTMLAVAEQRGGIQIWKPQEKIVLRRRNTGGQCIHSIAWSPDNRYLLAGTTDGTTRIWDVLNDLRRHVLLLPLSGTAGPGIAVADEGDYRGPPGIQQYLRYVVDSRRGHQTLYANEFYNTRGWVNEPWQVGLFQPSKEEIKRLYVRAGAQVPCDGRTWETAFSDLQDALSRATDGTEIWVAQGTYRPDRGTGSRLASFVIRDGIRVYGGFRGDETTAFTW
ncbi:MAG: WD40 repeat domain-containing protein, partial [Sedimentisphaerales bacterium]